MPAAVVEAVLVAAVGVVAIAAETATAAVADRAGKLSLHWNIEMPAPRRRLYVPNASSRLRPSSVAAASAE